MKNHTTTTVGATVTPDQILAALDDQNRAMSEFRASTAKTLRGSFLQGAIAVPVGTIPGGVTPPRPTSSPGAIVGWSLNNTAGVDAVVRIYDGMDTSGDLKFSITIKANSSKEQWFGPAGISIGDAGLFVQTVSGSFEGALFLRGLEE